MTSTTTATTTTTTTTPATPPTASTVLPDAPPLSSSPTASPERLSAQPNNNASHRVSANLSGLRHITSNPSISLTTSNAGPSTGNTPTKANKRGSSPGPLNLAPTANQPHRLGSRSPASIPSSPTSVHSSSSAIFERDIEQVPALTHPSPMHQHTHSHTQRTLDAAVPTVLSSAAAALTSSVPTAIHTTEPEPFVTVLSPATAHSPSTAFATLSSLSAIPHPRSGVASPSFTSRSPSPTASHTSPGTHPAPLPGSHSPPTHHSPPSNPSLPDSLPLPAASQAAPPVQSPSTPSMKAQNRLSFISYSDLLQSTPITAVPLSSITSPVEPPPHIPAVETSLAQPPASPLSAHPSPSQAGLIQGQPTSIPPGHQQHIAGALGLGNADLGDSEWKREGFGKGLEERLEALMVGETPSA